MAQVGTAKIEELAQPFPEPVEAFGTNDGGFLKFRFVPRMRHSAYTRRQLRPHAIQ